MTLSDRHARTRIAAAFAAAIAAWALLAGAPAAHSTEPEVVLGGPKVLLAFHPGGGPPNAPTVFQRLADRETLCTRRECRRPGRTWSLRQQTVW